MYYYLSIPAAMCSTSASLPQLLMSSNKHSTATMCIRGIGSLLWMWYGLLRHEYVLAACSAFAGLVEFILIVKMYVCRSSPADSASSPAGDSDDRIDSEERHAPT